MTVTHLPPRLWTGREDPEDAPLSRRVFHYMGDEGSKAVIGFACDAGVSRNKGRIGAKAGPEALRAALTNLAVPVDFPKCTDLGDVCVDDNALEAGQDLLAETLGGALGRYDRVLVFGGGHETAYGSYQGLRRAFPDKSIGIINLDAHLDLRAIGEAGPSSGTPFYQIRQHEGDTFDYLCIGAAKESNTQALLKRAKDWGVKIVHDTDLLENPHSAEPQIDAIASRNDLIYLTIDIDLLPHYQAPGVSAPAARGVPFQTVEHLVSQVLQSCAKHKRPLPLADIVELSPQYDRDNMTAKSAAYLALRLLS